MSDLTQLVTENVTAYLLSEAGQKQVAEQVQKVTARAVEAATGYGSPFAEALKAAVARALKVPTEFDLTAYNDFVVKVVTEVVHNAMSAAVAAQVEARLERIIPPIPAETSLSAIAQKFADDCKDNHRVGGSVDDEISILCERQDNEFTYLYLDKRERPASEKHRFDVRVGVYRDKIFSLNFGGTRVEE